jgi:hypothetical protein
MLTPSDLNTARQTYPEAFGLRVLISGWIMVLDPNPSAMKACWRRRTPVTFGDRPVAFDLIDHTPTTAEGSLAYGSVVAREPNMELAAAGCLGLAITLPDRQDVITTATHCFVKLPKKSLIRTALEIAYSTISHIFAGPPMRSVPAVVRSTSRRTDGAIGREIWMVASNNKIKQLTS